MVCVSAVCTDVVDFPSITGILVMTPRDGNGNGIEAKMRGIRNNFSLQSVLLKCEIMVLCRSEEGRWKID